MQVQAPPPPEPKLPESGPEPGPAPSAERASYRSGFFFGTLSFFAVAAAGLLSTVLTSRLYGVRIIGSFALVSAPVAAMWVLSTVKEQQALIKEITQLPARHPRVTQLFAVVFLFSSTLTALVALLDATACWFVFRGPLNAPQLLAPALVSIAGYAIVTNTGWNIDSILSAFVAGRQIFWVRVHEVVSFIVIAMLLGLLWHSVWGLVIATIGASASSLAHRVLAARRFVRARLSRRELRAGMSALPELLRFGLRATPGQIAQGASQQGGVWALGMVAPIYVVGAYSRALTIPARLQQASMRVTEVLYPTLVGRHSGGDGDGFDRALIDSIRYETIGMLLLAALIGGAALPILEVFGNGFGRASNALVLLALYPAFASITVTQTQALWATGRPGRTSVIALVRLAVTVALLVALTPSLGVLGPAIALLAGYVVVVVLSGLSLRASLARPLRATWPLRERLALLGAYASAFAAVRAISRALPSLAALPLSLTVGAFLYLAVFVAFGAVNGRDRARLSAALRLARSWRVRRAQRAAARAAAF
ncbi:MAG TPA: polysaccharide biosynthesis C-terminal domain-containing protein [Solirubrobacteraceae bacterium]|nr:polysaccharide biosynthesis C-terminal domain-containing protein [Solirubrobacteraceae bacterium]